MRTLRRERGLTLKGLGRLAGLSHPFLSQVERGLARPSVGSVERIAAALDVSVAHLWTPPRHGDADRSCVATRATSTRSPACANSAVSPGRPVLREWSARTRRWPEEPSVEHGEIAIYVARGSIEVDLDGVVHSLDEGDTLRFDGSDPAPPAPHRRHQAPARSSPPPKGAWPL